MRHYKSQNISKLKPKIRSTPLLCDAIKNFHIFFAMSEQKLWQHIGDLDVMRQEEQFAVHISKSFRELQQKFSSL